MHTPIYKAGVHGSSTRFARFPPLGYLIVLIGQAISKRGESSLNLIFNTLPADTLGLAYFKKHIEIKLIKYTSNQELMTS